MTSLARVQSGANAAADEEISPRQAEETVNTSLDFPQLTPKPLSQERPDNGRSAFHRASLSAAISAGAVWTPEFHTDYARAVIADRREPGALSSPAARALVEAARSFLSETVASSSPLIELHAADVRAVLRDSEEDEARHRTKDRREDGTDPSDGFRNESRTVLVTRFGVRIARAYIKGYLNLSGLALGRALIFSNCRFTHTVNLAQARLGALSFSDGCLFDDPPTDTRTHYADGAGWTADEAQTGSLPAWMQNCQGVNAAYSDVSGDVDCTGLTCGRVDFSNSRVRGVIDLDMVKVTARGSDNPEAADQYFVGVNLSGCTAQHIFLRGADIDGALNLTEAEIVSAELIGARISGLVRRPDGNRWRSLTGRSLRVKSDLILHDARLAGALYLHSAQFGGNLRFTRTHIFGGLSEEFVERISASGAPTSFVDRETSRIVNLRNATIGGEITFGELGSRTNYQQPADEDGDIFVCDGEIDGRGMQVRNLLAFQGCKLTNEVRARTTIIDLRHAQIGSSLVLRKIDRASRGDIDLRGARTLSYRDDFDYVHRRPAQRLVQMPIFLVALARGVIIRALPYLFIWVMKVFGDFRSLDPRRGIARVGELLLRFRRWVSGTGGWPQGVRFVLAGFEYTSFPIRDDAAATDDSDNTRMPLINRARKRWLAHQPEIWTRRKFQPLPWVHCAKVLRELGYDHDAHEIMLERERRALYSIDVGILEKFFRWLLIASCGHGHEMTRLIPIGGLVFAIGFLANDVAINANLVRPTNAEILVDDDYKANGAIPPDYSSLNALPYTVRRMLPLPPMAGSNEWAACNWRQIRNAIVTDYPGACVPRSCHITSVAPDKVDDFAAAADAQCRRLPVVTPHGNLSSAEGGRHPVSLRDRSSQINANILAGAPAYITNSLARLAVAYRWLFRRDLVDDVNRYFVNGGLTQISMALSFAGWAISIILATYATGTLKRRE